MWGSILAAAGGSLISSLGGSGKAGGPMMLKSTKRATDAFNNRLADLLTGSTDYSEDYGQSELWDRLSRSPEDPYTDELLGQMRRTYNAGLNKTTSQFADQLRNAYASRGFTGGITAGGEQRDMARLYQDAIQQSGEFYQNQLFEKAGRQMQMDSESYERALNLVKTSMGSPTNYQQATGPNPIWGGLGGALGTAGGMMFASDVLKNVWKK